MDNNKKLTDLITLFNDNLEEFKSEIKSFKKLINKKNKKLYQPILSVIQLGDNIKSISL